MIFTQIFRYLDDRDAEEVRRQSTDNSRSQPIADSRFQELSVENRDNQFGQISCKGAPCLLPEGKQTRTRTKSPSSAPLAQGFSTLRVDTRRGPKTTTGHSVLPPIAKAPIRTNEKQLVVNDKIPVKLPPIDPLTGKAPCTKKRRSCSMMNGEALCENTMSGPQYPGRDQQRSRTLQDRAALQNSDGKVMQAIDLAGEKTDCLIKDSKSAESLQKERRRTQFSFDDMSLAKASIKTAFNQRNAKKLDSETTKIVESTKTDEINAEKTSNYLISGQFEMRKHFSDGGESREQYRKMGDVYTLLAISEPQDTQDGRLSVERNIAAVKTRCNSSPCVQSAEYLSLQTFEASNNHVCSSLVTEGNNETKVRLVTFDKGRRNAICEVLEKSIGPQYGSSLYEKRQNLMSM